MIVPLTRASLVGCLCWMLAACAAGPYYERHAQPVPAHGQGVEEFTVDSATCARHATAMRKSLNAGPHQPSAAERAVHGALAGALLGAAYNAATGAAVGAVFGNAGYGAKVGTAYGGSSGALTGAFLGAASAPPAEHRLSRSENRAAGVGFYAECMSHRGYTVQETVLPAPPE